MKKFKVTIEGIAPILQCRHPSPEEMEKEFQTEKGSKKKIKQMNDEEQYQMHAYIDKKGRYYQPSTQIEAALVKAALSFKYEGKKTYKDLFKAGVLVEESEIYHDPKTKFVPFGEYARNIRVGAVWVVRPRADDWKLTFHLNLILDEQISTEVLKEVLEYAGIAVGIGAWRPRFGRFVVKEFKEVK